MRVLVELAVGVGDQFQCQRVNPRIAEKRRDRELGQQHIVPRRQVAAHLAQRVFDDVEIVDQPLGIDPVRSAGGGELFMTWFRISLFCSNCSSKGLLARRRGASTQTGASARAWLSSRSSPNNSPRIGSAPGIDQHDRHRLRDHRSRQASVRRRTNSCSGHSASRLLLKLKVCKTSQKRVTGVADGHFRRSTGRWKRLLFAEPHPDAARGRRGKLTGNWVCLIAQRDQGFHELIQFRHFARLIWLTR